MKNRWAIVSLAEIVTPIQRAEVPIEGKAYRQIGVRLWGQGAYERETIDGSETKYPTLSRVEADDIIVNKIWARNGSVAVVDESLTGCFGSSEFPTFVPNRTVLNPRWFHWITKTKSFWYQCDVKSKGTSGQNRIRPEKFLEVTIPLPSTTEQQRIITRIEELAAKIEEAWGLRLDTIKQAEKLHGSFVASLFKSHLKAKRVEIEELADVRGGIQKGAHRTPKENPVRYLTVAHVHRNRILMSDPRFFEVSKEELERWRLVPGDVLIIEGNGSAEQIGRTAIFRGELKDCVHQNHVIRIRPNKKAIDPEFLNLYLNSPDGQNEVQSLSRTSSGLRTLSVGRIKKIAVPLLPLTIQAEILNSANALQSKIDSLKQLQSQTAAELDAMLPAVLDKAFKGEL